MSGEKAVNPLAAKGALPEGTTSERAAASAVQSMFDSIAPRYDLLNHLLSASIDRLWWWRAARAFRLILANDRAQIADICCGTGDMTLALLRRRSREARPIVAIDFAHQMLTRGAAKFGTRGACAIEADALHLPFAEGSLDLVISAFGFRNLSNYTAGLEEFFRVLKSSGQVGILDFSEPPGLLGKIYALYFRRVLPFIGRTITGRDGPYAYLPASVQRFPAPAAMLGMMRDAGFIDVSWTSYTFGVAGLFRGTKR